MSNHYINLLFFKTGLGVIKGLVDVLLVQTIEVMTKSNTMINVIEESNELRNISFNKNSKFQLNTDIIVNLILNNE